MSRIVDWVDLREDGDIWEGRNDGGACPKLSCPFSSGQNGVRIDQEDARACGTGRESDTCAFSELGQSHFAVRPERAARGSGRVDAIDCGMGRPPEPRRRHLRRQLAGEKPDMHCCIVADAAITRAGGSASARAAN
jgi:hypothetical protein